MTDDRRHLQEARKAIAEIEQLTKGITLMQFEDQDMLQAAVKRQIGKLQRALSETSPRLRAQDSTINWELRMPGSLPSTGVAIDTGSLWHLVREELPAMRERLAQVSTQPD